MVEHLDRYHHMQIVVVGDFNVPGSNLNYSAPGGKTFAENFRLATSAAGLEEHVCSLTRWGSGEACSALDYVFSNEEKSVDGLTVYYPLRDSEVCSVTFTVRTTPVRLEATSTLSRDFDKTNWTSLTSIVSTTEWDTVFDETDIDQCWHNIREIISYAVDETTAVFIQHVRTMVDWLASRTSKQLRLKRSLCNRFRLSSFNTD